MLRLKDPTHRDVVFYIVLGFVLASAAITTIFLVKLFFYPFGVNSVGNDALNYFISIKSLYPTYASHPAAITTYMPLYYLLFYVSKSLLQIPGYPFSAERAMTYAALFIDICLLYLVSRNIAKMGKRYALLAVLIFYADFFIFASLSFYDPVLFELILDLVALLLINSRLKSSYAYAAVAMALALFFKQTAIIVVLGILAYYLLNKQRKEAVGFLSVFLLIVIPATIYTNFITNGGFIESTILLPLNEPIKPFNILYWWDVAVFSTLFVPLLLLCLKRGTFKKTSLLVIILVAELLGTLSLYKTGSTQIYLLVPFAFACIIGISNLEKFKNPMIRQKPRWRNSSALPLVITIFVLLSVGIFLFQAALSNGYNNPTTSEIVSALKEANGNILVEDPQYALDANKSLVFNADPTEFIPSNYKLWNDSYLISEIENRSFAAIEFPINKTNNRFSRFPGLMQAINNSYIEEYNFSGTYIDVPRSYGNTSTS